MQQQDPCSAPAWWHRVATSPLALRPRYLKAVRSMPLWRPGIEASYRALRERDFPVLFVWGDEDGVVPCYGGAG